MDGGAAHGAARSWSGQQIRFMTAGSVDDGKSTLIGRLLLDSHALMRDQAAGLEGDDIDLAALTDGLEAERAQGITIDVAYRYFATPRTSFIIADAPGHEQYTRNMVTAASVSDVAVLVIDAARVENGQLKPQTRRHAAVAGLMGLDLIVVVNKMDLVGWSQERFDEVRTAFGDVAGLLGLKNIAFTPVSAKRGDNIVRRGGADWYDGPTLVEQLESARPRESQADGPLRLPVQVVLRHGGTRYYAGRIESGAVRPGDKVRVGPAAVEASVAQVRIGGVGVARAEAGASVAVELAEDRDLAQGGVIADAQVRYTRRFAADLCWLDENAWVRGRRYRLRQGALETQALIEDVRFVRDMSNLAEAPASTLKLNDIARVSIAARDPILADLYDQLPGTGAFVLFDPDTNQTAAAGMIREILP
ncbi:MAG TPA: GTP-binding protein [Terricaulis sp.]|nr:GTP-binding protein [Terricaulis sp.]